MKKPDMKNKHLLAPIMIYLVLLTGCSQNPVDPNLNTIYKEEPMVLSLDEINPSEYLYLFEYDDNAPLNIKVKDQKMHKGATWIELTYNSPQGGNVPATLVLPGGAGPFAGILIMHGMPADRQSMYSLAEIYAQTGAACLLIDAPFNRPENADRRWLSNTPLDFTEQDKLDQIQLIVDLRRGVDLMLARPEIDPDRLGYIGISYGGVMGGLLAGVEDRLKAYALVVGDGGLVTHLTGLDDLNAYPKGLFYRMPVEVQENWLKEMWPIEPIHYVSLAAPAALLFQNGTQDTLVPPTDANRYQKAGSQPKTILWYKGGHGIAGDMKGLVEQLDWMHEKIGTQTLFVQPNFNQEGILINQLAAGWTIVSLLCTAFGSWKILRRTGLNTAARFIWIWTVLVLGPLGLLVYWLASSTVQIDADAQLETAFWKQAAASSAWTASLLIPGLFLASEFAVREIIPMPWKLLTYFAFPLVASWTGFKLLNRFDRPTGSRHAPFQRSFSVEFLTCGLALLWAIPGTQVAATKFTAPIVLTIINPSLLVMLNLAAVGASVLIYPALFWMLKHGMIWTKPHDGAIATSSRQRPAGLFTKTMLVILGTLAFLISLTISLVAASGLSLQVLLQQLTGS